MSEYLEGGSYLFYFQGEGINFLFQGSANFIEQELEGIRPTTAVIAPGGYENVDQYQKRLIGRLQPKAIFLNHFDDFLLPYSKEMRPLNRKELAKFMDEFKQFHHLVELTVPQFFKEIAIED